MPVVSYPIITRSPVDSDLVRMVGLLMFSAMLADIVEAFISGYAASNTAITRSKMDADAILGSNANIEKTKITKKRELYVKINPHLYLQVRGGKTAPSLCFINLHSVDYRPD